MWRNDLCPSISFCSCPRSSAQFCRFSPRPTLACQEASCGGWWCCYRHGLALPLLPSGIIAIIEVGQSPQELVLVIVNPKGKIWIISWSSWCSGSPAVTRPVSSALTLSSISHMLLWVPATMLKHPASPGERHLGDSFSFGCRQHCCARCGWRC